MTTPTTLTFDIRVVSEANQREHWAARMKRKKAQQHAFHIAWLSARPKVTLPATVTFTRYAVTPMDSDNLAGSFKHVRDQLARELGIDDGSDQVAWRYAQELIGHRRHYFTVTFE